MNYNDLKKYYNNKKVFVTGHTGFKGSWMISWLKMLGAEIKGYALSPENEFDLYHEINGDSICESVISDIKNKEKIVEEIVSFQPDFIFHLAAQPLVRLSYDIPVETFEVNTIGTANLLEGVRQLEKPCAVVCITTDKVYENKEWNFPYREIDRLGGYDPYSASKACAELILSSYRNSFFNKNDYSNHKKSISTARAGNVIGGGDWAKDRIIPDIVRALKNGDKIEIRSPHAVRPWQHVLEPIGGYLILGAKMIDDPIKYSKSWNFGPNLADNLPVESLVKIAIEEWGNGEYYVPKNIEHPHEAGLLKLDISQSINELKWLPKYDALAAIKKTIDWYKNKTEVVEFVNKQISEFIQF